MAKRVLILLCVILLFAGCKSAPDNQAISSSDNTYETPLQYTIRQLNNKDTIDAYIARIGYYNGVCDSQLQSIYTLMKQSTHFEGINQAANEDFKAFLENMETRCGSDFAYSYKITEKQQLDQDALMAQQQEFQQYIAYLEESADAFEGYDGEAWEAFAQAQGLSLTDAKALAGAIKDLTAALKELKFEDGYKLSYTLILNGSKLAAPEEEARSCRVYQLNGRWVNEDVIYYFHDLYTANNGF